MAVTASGDTWYADSAAVDEPEWHALSGSDRYAACLRAARTGSREARAALVKDLTPLVWHVARGNGLDRTNAEDVVQTVWLALFSHIAAVSEPRALAGWLITTTRREARRVRGRIDLQPRLIDEVAAVIDQDAMDPAEQAVRADRDNRLWRAFTQLPGKCQELLRLTVLAGRAEYRMVADALHMPRGSIGPTRGRCLSVLREKLDIEGGSA
ncbi:RNA polymerase subunit sigma [Actinosynnema sp. ALI-1.44]|nr:RNA polymerase subunit sigma [Actinosynnema sp. ALI-1.44]